MRVMLLALLLVGCAPSVVAEQRNDVGNTHVERADASRARFRTGMRHHGDDLRYIDKLLRHGKLAEAQTIAFWLTRHEDPDVALAARALLSTTTLPAAHRVTARVANACGGCHVRAGVPAFAFDPVAPRDDGSIDARLRRHRWAAARVWDGVVGASEPQWRAGLEVFASDISGYRTHRIATHALEGGYEDRATAYGELLVSCMACHPR